MDLFCVVIPTALLTHPKTESKSRFLFCDDSASTAATVHCHQTAFSRWRAATSFHAAGRVFNSSSLFWLFSPTGPYLDWDFGCDSRPQLVLASFPGQERREGASTDVMFEDSDVWSRANQLSYPHCSILQIKAAVSECRSSRAAQMIFFFFIICGSGNDEEHFNRAVVILSESHGLVESW